MTNQDLIKIGFKEIPHFTIGNVVLFDLGRYRSIAASSMGTPNEMLYIQEVSDKNPKEITDLVCIHNYDYDGYLTIMKLETLLKFFTSKKKKIK